MSHLDRIGILSATLAVLWKLFDSTNLFHHFNSLFCLLIAVFCFVAASYFDNERTALAASREKGDGK